MSDVEPIQDYIVLRVPREIDTDAPDIRTKMDNMARLQVMQQYAGKGLRALLMEEIEWLITSDWQDVEAFQPAHDCVTCRAANDQAVAFLKEHPDQRLALGNLRYVEIW